MDAIGTEVWELMTVYQRLAAVAVVVASACLSPGLANAACTGGNFNWYFAGDEVPISRDVTNATSCRFRFYSSGNSIFLSADVTAKASHGVFGKGNLFDFAYVPTKGYVGTDHATLKICGKVRDAAGCSTLQFTFNLH